MTKRKTTPKKAPKPVGLTFTDCSFHGAEAGRPPSEASVAAVQTLAEAILECAKALRGTRRGIQSAPLVVVGSGS